MNEKKIKLNLQYFAEDPSGQANEDPNTTVEDGSANTEAPPSEVDISAFTEIISEKDKEIKQLQAELAAQKKTNANLLLKISAGDSSEKQTTEEKIYGFMNPRKE